MLIDVSNKMAKTDQFLPLNEPIHGFSPGLMCLMLGHIQYHKIVLPMDIPDEGIVVFGPGSLTTSLSIDPPVRAGRGGPPQGEHGLF